MTRRERHSQLLELSAPAMDQLDEIPPPVERSRQIVPVRPVKPRGLDGDLAQKLEQLTERALDKADEVLDIELDSGSDNYGDELRAVNTAIKTVVQTQVRVDEHRLRARKLDVLPKLLEAIKDEERRRLAIVG